MKINITNRNNKNKLGRVCYLLIIVVDNNWQTVTIVIINSTK